MSKKIAKIELRISPELKEQLSILSCKKGGTISSSVREMIEKELSNTEAQPIHFENRTMIPRFPQFTKTAITGIVCISLGIASSLSIFQQDTHAQASIRMAFSELDTNGDGVIQRQEYNANMFDETVIKNAALPSACKEEPDATVVRKSTCKSI